MNFQRIFRTPKDSNFFFGYYDKSPICKFDKKHLALKVNFFNRAPKWGDKALIGFFEFNNPNGSFKEICESNIFNWQQANRLQWFGDNSTHIFFNNLENNKFSSVLMDLSSGARNIFDISIYDISKDYSYALCIDHERHHWVRRWYSYDGIYNKLKQGDVIENDGIYKLNFNNKSIKKLIDIKDLLSIYPVISMKQSLHYVEHIMISPNSKKFAFLHRWKLKTGDIYSRLYTCNADGSNLYLLNDSGRMSHFCWINDQELFGWGGSSSFLSNFKNIFFNSIILKLLKSFYKLLIKSNPVDGLDRLSSFLTNDSYMFFNDLKKNLKKVPISIINKNGHPSYNKYNEHIILTDTYPNMNSMASLILYNYIKQKITIIDELKSLPEADNTNFRCDLHPKWSYSGNFISIDTMDAGMRSIYVYKKK